uniref:Rit1_C domain-containing protein n=1 Tax=Macrostomum lignano TaxID=282301 RepID=A0A1I8F2T7_9PLAT
FLAEQERQRSTKTAATEAAIEVSTLNAASTPLDVAKQLDEAAQDGGGGNLVRDSALAVVDEQYYWTQRTAAHWRSLPLRTGRRVAPNLRALSRAALPLLSADAPFEWLELPLPVALDMFKHNRSSWPPPRGRQRFAAAASLGQRTQRQQQPAASVARLYKVGDFTCLAKDPSESHWPDRPACCSRLCTGLSLQNYGSLARVQGIAAAPPGMSPAEVADWADAALEKASELNSTSAPIGF